MQPSPLYFVHGRRVVRGSLRKKLNQHRMLVAAENYVLADGSNQPIPLDFTRRLGHEEVTTDASVLLALVADEEA